MQVENLGKLERRVQISVAVADIEKEVDTRLKRLSRTVRMAGFRPGKVPMKIVTQQYGFQVHNEVLGEKVNGAFAQAVNENALRVAGSPSITPAKTEGASDSTVSFDATFEVYPDVKVEGLDAATVTRANTTVDDAAVDRTIEILRKQRGHFHAKAGHDHGHHDHEHHDDGGHGHEAPAGTPDTAQPGDRVTVDFVGTIDGTPFPGGAGEGVTFVVGEGRMLPEFEAAVTGKAEGERTSVDLVFPADYHGADVAGKAAHFDVTVKAVEWAHLPAVDADFARSLGVADGDLTRMRSEIRANLDREVNKRLKARTKDSVMNALLASTHLEVPKALIDAEIGRLTENAREEMRRRGMASDAMPLTPDLFAPQAERRVRLGLVLATLVEEHGLAAKPEQVKAHVEELAQSYERPAEVVRWYFADPTRLGEVEAVVLEENVVDHVLGTAKVEDVHVPFDELMGNA